jgi:triosephosphate isomerase
MPGTPAPRRLLVAGNWKMNGDRTLAATLCAAAAAAARAAPEVDVAVFPPATLLEQAAAALSGTPVAVGGQTCHGERDGAHTGALSAGMLRDAGCRSVLVGHSEVRTEQAQDDAAVARSVAAARAAGLAPILCVGETRAEREAGRAREVVERQIGAVLAGRPDAADGLDVAYEPVWAIGTGRSATPAEAGEVHGWIRGLLEGARGGRARILYGGSVTPDNIGGFLAVPGVDGVLVGGRSLDPTAFTSLVEAARAAAVRRLADRRRP